MKAGEDRFGLIAGGTWCADHNKLVDCWPGEEDHVEILEQDIRGGGPACNLAIGMKRLDPEIPVSTIGLLGDDEDGRTLMSQAERECLECSGLLMLEGHRTSFTDAFTSKNTGRRTHLYYPGTSSLLTPDHFDFTNTGARILHLGLPGLHDQMDAPWKGCANGWVAVLRAARSIGIKTNLELCSLPAKRLAEVVTPCLRHLDYLIINEFEVAALAGRPIRHGTDSNIGLCLANARDVLESGEMELIVVHFPSGSVAITKSGDPIITPSVRVPESIFVGSNGAGDAFASGVLYGLHEGWALELSLELAHASAAASMRQIGTTDAIEAWSKCLSLARDYGLNPKPGQLHGL